MEQKFLTIKQFAKLVQMNEQTIRKMCRNRELPAIKLGSEWRISVKALELG